MVTRLTEALRAAIRAWRRDPRPVDADSLARRDAVIASVSHELRTPLTVLRGVAETLVSRGFVDERGTDLLDAHHRALDALEALLGDVLQAAEELDPAQGRRDVVPVDLVQLCRELVRTELAEGPTERHDPPEPPTDDPPAGSHSAAAFETRPQSPSRDTHDDGPELVITTVPSMLVRALDAAVAQQVQVTPTGQPLELRVALDAREVRVEIRSARAHPPVVQAREPAGSGGVGLHLMVAEALVEHLGGTVEVVDAGTSDQRIVVRLPQRRRTDRTSGVIDRRMVVIPAGRTASLAP